MQYTYFICNWIIQPTVSPESLSRLFNVASALDCYPLIKGEVTIKGLHALSLVFRVPDERAFRSLQEQMREHFNFSECETMVEDSYSGESLNAPIKHIADFADHLNQLGKQNQALRRSDVSTFTCEWEAHPLVESDLSQIFRILDTWDYSLYYQPKLKQSSKISFIAKTRDLTSMQAFVDQLRPIIHLTNWAYIDPMASLSAMDEARPLTRENQKSFAAFLREIRSAL